MLNPISPILILLLSFIIVIQSIVLVFAGSRGLERRDASGAVIAGAGKQVSEKIA
jgi:hypothetical protein